jgi:hypothetical protein
MKINFETKEESKAKQIDDFLKLSMTDHINAFINLLLKANSFQERRSLTKATIF